MAGIVKIQRLQQALVFGLVGRPACLGVCWNPGLAWWGRVRISSVPKIRIDLAPGAACILRSNDHDEDDDDGGSDPIRSDRFVA